MLQRRLLGLCIALSALFVAFVGGVHAFSGPGYDFLIWNLVLAWVPLVAALALDDLRGAALWLQAPLLALWLAFFPNAPYLLTDLIHFGHPHGNLPSALAVAILALAAVAGLVIGFSSLTLVERGLRDRFGVRPALAVSLLSLVAASAGIYLGRVLRLNSWDLLARPREVLHAIEETLLSPGAHPLAAGGTIALAALLAASYLRFRRASLR
jgi:uncharacterized membrane protein